jgi:hypothetical protein
MSSLQFQYYDSKGCREYHCNVLPNVVVVTVMAAVAVVEMS